MYDLREIGSLEVTDDLFALASGFSSSVNSYTGCVISSVKWLTYARDCRWKTKNSGVSMPCIEENTFYGLLEEILAFSYIFKNWVLLFKYKWFDTNPKKKRLLTYKNITSIFINSEWYKDDPFIFLPKPNKCSTLLLY